MASSVRSKPSAKPRPGVAGPPYSSMRRSYRPPPPMRVLRAEAGVHLHLEHRARVVVEPAHELRLLDVRDAESVEVRLHCRVVRRAVVAELVTQQRRSGHHGYAAGVLAVERAQRVGVRAAVALLAQVAPRGRGCTPATFVAVRRAARLVAHRVERAAACSSAGMPSASKKRHEHRDDLGISGRLGGAEHLDADLPELPHAALLRALVAEHRTGVVELRLRAVGRRDCARVPRGPRSRCPRDAA